MSDSAALLQGDPMAVRRGPTVRRRRLASELRKIRNRLGLSAEDVAKALGWSPSKVTYMERLDAKRPDPMHVDAVCRFYGVEDAKRAELVALAKQGRERGWWFLHNEALPEPYKVLLDFEAESSTRYVWEPLVIPGILQTREYARALMLSGPAELAVKEIDQRVDVRMARQEALLQQDEPLRLLAIMDEAAIRRPVGGSDVMGMQLRYLLEVAALPNVTLQILPFAAGAHAGTLGAFSILEFPDPDDPAVVYAETVARQSFFEDTDEVRYYTRTFQKLTAVAASPDDTIRMIAAAADDH